MFKPITIYPSCILLAGLLTSCSTGQKPISTSLLDITGESRVTNLKGGPFGWFKLFEQHEAFSANGLLPMPEVGQEYYFPGSGDPTSAIGIAVAQSYKLIGESETPSANEVQKVRAALEEVQLLSLQLVMLDKLADSLRTELSKLSTNRPAFETPSSILITNLSAELSNLTREKDSVRTNLFDAQQRLRTVANTPGIIIARWRAADGATGSVAARPAGSVSYDSGTARSGFIILGGIRFVSLVYGEDFWWLLNNLRPHERSYVRDFGVTTYLIQASNIAYTSELDLSRVAKLTASLSSTKFTIPNSVELEAGLEQFGQFANAGNLGRITWKREPYCFVCGIDLPDLTTNKCDKVIQRFFEAQDHWPAATGPGSGKLELEPSFQAWRTVVAKVAHVGRVTATRWPPLFGKRVWDHYQKPRSMQGAPACPICGGQTNVVIPGSRELRSEKLCPTTPLGAEGKPSSGTTRKAIR